MKKGLSIVILLAFLLISLPAILAEDENKTDIVIDDELSTSGVDKAYDCLRENIDEKTCDELSFEEKAFSVMATGKCAKELSEESDDEECWPDGDCSIKKTAQAILARDRIRSSVDDAVDWLYEQNQTIEGLEWFLQIDSNEEMKCSITYDDESKTIDISEDKKISKDAGSCLTRSYSDYWLRISPNCQDKEFEITCTKGFQTNLLYKKQTSETVYVSESTNSASAEGSTTEQISAQCFADGGECDYEGTLWATLALSILKEDVSPYVRYLVTMAEDNEELFPEAFLYHITNHNSFKLDILEKQKESFWDESGDKFFDTALAALPLYYDKPSQLEKAKKWLLEAGVQDKDGCWKGNLRNTAFLLYSIWPRTVASVDSTREDDCETSGFFCMSTMKCSDADGSILSGFDCGSISKCCDKQAVLESCGNQGGSICNSAEECSGGIEVTASGLDYGQTCCMEGSCQIPVAESECEANGGQCRPYDCGETEDEVSYSCNDGGTCCMKKDITPAASSLLWLWIVLMIILIVLIVLGIIYKDNVEIYYHKLMANFGKGKGRPSQPMRRGPPGMPPSRMMPQRMATTRRVMPPVAGGPAQRPQAQRPQGQAPQLRAPQYQTQSPVQPSAKKGNEELQEVLSKLKEMGK